jgi:hypothetical protein
MLLPDLLIHALSVGRWVGQEPPPKRGGELLVQGMGCRLFSPFGGIGKKWQQVFFQNLRKTALAWLLWPGPSQPVLSAPSRLTLSIV